MVVGIKRQRVEIESDQAEPVLPEDIRLDIERIGDVLNGALRWVHLTAGEEIDRPDRSPAVLSATSRQLPLADSSPLH